MLLMYVYRSRFNHFLCNICPNIAYSGIDDTFVRLKSMLENNLISS